MMKWFLKCFYGYRNLWDEILFRGILNYIDIHYPDVQSLAVEVWDKEWMEKWWDMGKNEENFGRMVKDGEMNSSFGGGFINGTKKIEFVEISKDIRDNFRYDIYFFGGGEVFAESRWWLHGWWNYLLRYFFALNTKPFVFLWGFETPKGVWQKILYKFLFPKAYQIICRDETSYKTARPYSHHAVLYHDFALDVVRSWLSLSDSIYKDKQYILVNMIAKMATEESFAFIQKFTELYPHCQIIYVHCGEKDRQYGERLLWAYPEASIYDWTEHDTQDILSLFANAQAGIGCRLHFLLLLQELWLDRHALVYAEKVQKLIQSNIEFPL